MVGPVLNGFGGIAKFNRGFMQALDAFAEIECTRFRS